MVDWGKVIIFILGIIAGWWMTAADRQPTIRECIPICSQMIE